MAKTTAKKTEKSYPSSIELRLDAPGMTALHRAGLGGLAATLRCAEILKSNADDEDEELPELLEPLFNSEFKWTIDKKSITLNFGKPENAGKFFEALSNFAFQIQDGVIYLPGQYRPGAPPPIEVRARLQQGIMLTFLQHVNTRTLDSEVFKSYQFDGKTIEYKFISCIEYLHQNKWKKWVDEGYLSDKTQSFCGSLYPGAAVRHVAYKATSASQPVEHEIALTFAVVGTQALPLSWEIGILIIPYVQNLQTFAERRFKTTPKDIKDVFVVNLSDAILRFSLNELGMEIKDKLAILGCEGCCLRVLPWYPRQKTRFETLTLQDISHDQLNMYAIALRNFKPRLMSKVENITEGKGKNKVVVATKTNYFWKDSKLRPFVADNLARGQYWFKGFAQYVKRLDESGKKTIWELVKYEQKDLNAMINDKNLDWKLDGAQPLVFAVQDALRRLYGKISSETQNLSDAGRNNRFESEYEKWRMAFAGAKTAEQFRNSFADMLSRAKSNQNLADNWQTIVKLLIGDWELSRDLALLALAGYQGKKSNDGTNGEENENNA